VKPPVALRESVAAVPVRVPSVASARETPPCRDSRASASAVRRVEVSSAREAPPNREVKPTCAFKAPRMTFSPLLAKESIPGVLPSRLLAP